MRILVFANREQFKKINGGVCARDEVILENGANTVILCRDKDMREKVKFWHPNRVYVPLSKMREAILTLSVGTVLYPTEVFDF